jgi:hypothetical protein
MCGTRVTRKKKTISVNRFKKFILLLWFGSDNHYVPDNTRIVNVNLSISTIRNGRNETDIRKNIIYTEIRNQKSPRRYATASTVWRTKRVFKYIGTTPIVVIIIDDFRKRSKRTTRTYQRG